jgi:hypothetical protein
LFGVETVCSRKKATSASLYAAEIGYARYRHNIRSLLSGETLEDNLGVSIDAQVIHSLGVDRAPLAVSSSLHSSGILKGREGATAESLHSCL